MYLYIDELACRVDYFYNKFLLKKIFRRASRSSVSRVKAFDCLHYINVIYRY